MFKVTVKDRDTKSSLAYQCLKAHKLLKLNEAGMIPSFTEERDSESCLDCCGAIM